MRSPVPHRAPASPTLRWLTPLAAGNAIDTIRGVFAADGSGHDKVLDSLQISIRPGDLVEDGIAGCIAGFFGRMTGCYAMPLNQRIANVAEGTVNAVGTAASVQAEVCRGLRPRQF